VGYSINFGGSFLCAASKPGYSHWIPTTVLSFYSSLWKRGVQDVVSGGQECNAGSIPVWVSSRTTDAWNYIDATLPS